jgi:hypothetical protein
VTARKLPLKESVYVSVPALYLWVAELKGMHQGDAEYLRLLQGNEHQLNASSLLLLFGHFERANAQRQTRFRSEVKRILGKGVIPFVRSEPDLSLASVVFGTGFEFKLYSEKSFVDCGFLRVFRSGDISYLDFQQDVRRVDADLPILLSDDTKRETLAFFDELTLQGAHFKAPGDEQVSMVISDLPSLLCKENSVKRCRVSIWEVMTISDGFNDGKRLSRDLGDLKLRIKKSGDGYFENMPPQTHLEMTAASLTGRSLLIHTDDFKIFGKLPDLTVDNAFTKANISPIGILERFTLGVMPMVKIEKELARSFSLIYPWFTFESF